MAFGIDGPIAEHKGLQWRSVRFSSFFMCGVVVLICLGVSSSRGISITIDRRYK